MIAIRRVRLASAAAITASLVAAAAVAHDVTPQPVRELVRIQGFRAPAPVGVPIAREVVLDVLGQQVRFAASDWRTFAFFDPAAAPTPSESSQLTLQGERPLLHSIVAARAEQRVTILAERRPGSVNLFVLTVDLCPSQ